MTSLTRLALLSLATLTAFSAALLPASSLAMASSSHEAATFEAEASRAAFPEDLFNTLTSVAVGELVTSSTRSRGWPGFGEWVGESGYYGLRIREPMTGEDYFVIYRNSEEPSVLDNVKELASKAKARGYRVLILDSEESAAFLQHAFFTITLFEGSARPLNRENLMEQLTNVGRFNAFNGPTYKSVVGFPLRDLVRSIHSEEFELRTKKDEKLLSYFASLAVMEYTSFGEEFQVNSGEFGFFGDVYPSPFVSVVFSTPTSNPRQMEVSIVADGAVSLDKIADGFVPRLKIPERSATAYYFMNPVASVASFYGPRDGWNVEAKYDDGRILFIPTKNASIGAGAGRFKPFALNNGADSKTTFPGIVMANAEGDVVVSIIGDGRSTYWYPASSFGGTGLFYPGVVVPVRRDSAPSTQSIQQPPRKPKPNQPQRPNQPPSTARNGLDSLVFVARDMSCSYISLVGENGIPAYLGGEMAEELENVGIDSPEKVLHFLTSFNILASVLQRSSNLREAVRRSLPAFSQIVKGPVTEDDILSYKGDAEYCKDAGIDPKEATNITRKALDMFLQQDKIARHYYGKPENPLRGREIAYALIFRGDADKIVLGEQPLEIMDNAIYGVIGYPNIGIMNQLAFLTLDPDSGGLNVIHFDQKTEKTVSVSVPAVDIDSDGSPDAVLATLVIKDGRIDAYSFTPLIPVIITPEKFKKYQEPTSVILRGYDENIVNSEIPVAAVTSMSGYLSAVEEAINSQWGSRYVITQTIPKEGVNSCLSFVEFVISRGKMKRGYWTYMESGKYNGIRGADIVHNIYRGSGKVSDLIPWPGDMPEIRRMMKEYNTPLAVVDGFSSYYRWGHAGLLAYGTMKNGKFRFLPPDKDGGSVFLIHIFSEAGPIAQPYIPEWFSPQDVVFILPDGE